MIKDYVKYSKIIVNLNTNTVSFLSCIGTTSFEGKIVQGLDYQKTGMVYLNILHNHNSAPLVRFFEKIIPTSLVDRYYEEVEDFLRKARIYDFKFQFTWPSTSKNDLLNLLIHMCDGRLTVIGSWGIEWGRVDTVSILKIDEINTDLKFD